MGNGVSYEGLPVNGNFSSYFHKKNARKYTASEVTVTLS
jgi:hypothetical protein